MSPSAGRPRPRRARRYWAPAAFLAPFACLFLIIYLVPTVVAVIESLYGVKRVGPFGPPQSVFAGLGNYREVFGDPAFRSSVLRIVAYGLGPGLAVVVLGLVLALLIDARVPGLTSHLFRLASFVPFAVPVVIGSIVWGFLYAPNTSPLRSLTVLTGISPLSSSWALYSVANIAVWTYAGYNMMIFLAALGSVDRSLYEAAAIDGANSIQMTWRIKLPLLRPAIGLCFIFYLIGTAQLFTEPSVLHVLTNAISSDWTPSMLAYNETAGNNYAYAAAVSVTMAVLAGTFSIVSLRAVNRWTR